MRNICVTVNEELFNEWRGIAKDHGVQSILLRMMIQSVVKLSKEGKKVNVAEVADSALKKAANRGLM